MTNKQAQITINAIKFMLDNAQYSEDVEEALNMAINALTAQEQLSNDSPELDNNFGDLISRRAAIDALKEHRNLFCDNTPDTFSVLPYGDKCRVDELDMAIATLINLPSAQSETHEKRTETHACDCISRSIAVEAVQKIAHIATLPDGDDAIRKRAVKYVLLHLPSAQPEIVRCRDCKHWKEGTVYSYCNKLFGMGVLDVYDYMTQEDDFCSMAERKTDG